MNKALGCLAYLALAAALTFVIDHATGADVAPVLRPWAALVAAALLVLGLSSIVELLTGYGRGERSRGSILARARTGEPPAGGGPMIVTGNVRLQSGMPLRAPLSGVECVAYDYRIYERAQDNDDEDMRHRTTVPHWWGMASLPFIIDADRRAIRVLAMPRLLDTPTTHKTEDVIERARRYVRTTTFEDKSHLGTMASAVTMFGELVSEQGSGVRHDWRRTGTTADPATLLIEEHALPVGVEVSVAGSWSPEHQAIVPQGIGGDTVTAVTGGAHLLQSHNSAVPPSALTVGVFAVILIALGTAIAWAASTGYLAASALGLDQ